MTALTILVAVFSALLATNEQERLRDLLPGESLEQQVDAYLTAYLTGRDFSGVIRVEHEGNVLLHKAYGFASYELGVPASVETAFNIGSLTKTFTAAAVTVLAEQGILSFDDPISRFLPDYPRGDEITIDMLLRHSAGIPGEHTLPDANTRRDEWMPLAEYVDWISTQPLDFDPGTGSAYSNTGYSLLAYLVEVASNQPFESFVHDALLAPLGMTRTATDDETALIQGRAEGYHPGPPPHHLRHVQAHTITHDIGSGSMLSTSGDLARWLRAIQEKRVFDIEALPYPYGWGVREYFGRRAIEQTGLQRGFASAMLLFPDDDLSVLVLSNIRSGASFSRTHRDIAAMVFDEPYEVPVPWVAAHVSTDELASLEGRYRLTDELTFSIESQTGHLMLAWDGFDLEAYLAPLGEDRFLNRLDNAELLFRRDGAGAVTEIVWAPGDGEIVCPRIE